MNKTEYLKKFAEKLSLTIEEVEAEFREIYANEVLVHKELTEDQHEQRALQRLAMLYKKQLRSPAVGFEGIIIGTSDCIDIIAKQKREATELFRTDPQTAISEGITNEEGMPLNTRRMWSCDEWGDGRPNPQYGKPLPEHNYLRNIWGIVVKTKGGEPKFFSMVLSGEKAEDETIPVFKPIKFMAIDRSQIQSEYKLNASQFTTFTIDEKLELPKYKEMIQSHREICPIKNLDDYHDNFKEDFNRLVCIEGDVSSLRLEPTSFGSRIMNLEDANASLEDLDAKGVTCWIPERINIDFAEGSKVLVVGRTAQGKKRDDLGNMTEELGDVSLNVYGMYALPEFKISLPDDIQPIENLETE